MVQQLELEDLLKKRAALEAKFKSTIMAQIPIEKELTRLREEAKDIAMQLKTIREVFYSYFQNTSSLEEHFRKDLERKWDLNP